MPMRAINPPSLLEFP